MGALEIGDVWAERRGGLLIVGMGRRKEKGAWEDGGVEEGRLEWVV